MSRLLIKMSNGDTFGTYADDTKLALETIMKEGFFSCGNTHYINSSQVCSIEIKEE